MEVKKLFVTQKPLNIKNTQTAICPSKIKEKLHFIPDSVIVCPIITIRQQKIRIALKELLGGIEGREKLVSLFFLYHFLSSYKK